MTGLEVIGLAAAGLGAAVSAVGSVSQGYAQRDALEYNARVAEMHATAAEDAARLDEDNSRKRTMRVQGTVRARAAASGLDISAGSPLEVLADNAAEGEFEALLARYSGTVEASRARNTAAQARAQGSNAVTAGWVGAGAQLLQSAGSAYKLYGGGGTTSGMGDLRTGAAARRAGYTWGPGEGW